MEPDQILKLVEEAADNIKYAQPLDETQWAYNEGIEDLMIELQKLVNKSKT